MGLLSLLLVGLGLRKASTIETLNLGAIFPVGLDQPLSEEWPVDNTHLHLIRAAAASIDFQKHFDPNLVAMFGPPIINISSILHPSLRVRTLFSDDQRAGVSPAIRAVNRMILGKDGLPTIKGLLGPAHDITAEAVASISGSYLVPQISYMATAASLSDKDLYPYFSRTIFTTWPAVKTMWKFLTVLHFKECILLHVDDELGHDYVSGFEQAREQSNTVALKTVGIATMTSFDSSLAREAARRLKEQIARMIFFVAISPQIQEVLLEEGVKPPEYQLCSVENRNFDLIPGWSPLHKIVPYMDKSDPQMIQMVTMMMTVGNPMVLPTIFNNSYYMQWFGLDKWEAPGFDAGKLAFIMQPPAEQSIYVSACYFNAFYSFILAFNKLLHDGLTESQIDGRTFLSAIRNVKFDGVGMKVWYDEYGDGSTPPALFATSEYNDGSWSVIPYFRADFFPPPGYFGMPFPDILMTFRNESIPATLVLGVAKWANGVQSVMPPVQYRACQPGQAMQLVDGVPVCQMCESGRFSSTFDAAECARCSLGTIANADRTACVACHPGAMAHETGMSECTDCTPGTFAKGSGSANCTRCPQGEWTNEMAATACIACHAAHMTTTSVGSISLTDCLCEEGAYMTGDGLCQLCPSGSTTDSSGSTSVTQCVCDPGEYLWRPRAAAAGECRSCPGGLSCPGGHGPPLQAGGFHTGQPSFDGDTNIFRIQCRPGQAICPEGSPLGSCPFRRVGRACDMCDVGYFEDGGDCVSCDSKPSFVPLLLMIICILLAVIGVYSYAVKEMSVQAASMMTIAMSTSLAVNVLQTMGAFQTIDLAWPEPMKSIFNVLSLFTFRMELINPGCVVKVNSPLFNYIGALAVHPIFVGVLLLAFKLAAVVPQPLGRRASTDQIINAQGLVLLTFYISLAIITAEPWYCKENPDGTSSVFTQRAVQCWGSQGHHAMIIASVVGILVYIVGFVALIFWATVKYPTIICQSGGMAFVHRFQFLFMRFHPERYYYGLLYCMRNLAIAILPVVFVGNVALQLLFTAFAITLVLTIQCKLQPWRSQVANYFDTFASSSVLMILVGGALSLEDIDQTQAENTVTILFVFVTLGLLVSFVAIIAWATYLSMHPGKQYGVFLSHHKVGAALLARYVKMAFQLRTKSVIFYDSDNLDRLDTLLEIVGFQVHNVVVLLTSETQRRIWCAGEIAIGILNKVNFVRVTCDDFVELTSEEIDNIADIWTDAQKNDVGKVGLSMEQIASTYYVFKAMPFIELRRTGPMEAQDHVIHQVFLQCKNLRSASGKVSKVMASTLSGMGPLPSNGSNASNPNDSMIPAKSTGSAKSAGSTLALLGDFYDVESVTLCFVLQRMLQRDLHIGVTVVAAGSMCYVGITHMIAVLTRGVLNTMDFAKILVSAKASGQLELVPLVADVSFTFPGPQFYDDLKDGKILSVMELDKQGIATPRVVEAYKCLFCVLAMRFTSHGSEVIQRTEISEMRPRLRAPDRPKTLLSQSSKSLGDLRDAAAGEFPVIKPIPTLSEIE